MIEKIDDNTVIVSTKNTSLLIVNNKVNKVSLEYFGPRIQDREEGNALFHPVNFAQGSCAIYEESYPNYSLSQAKLLLSTAGKSDLFSPSVDMENSLTSLFDFTFASFQIKSEVLPLSSLPFPHGAKEELVIRLMEKQNQVEAELHILPFEEEDVYGEYLVLSNSSEREIKIKKAASLLIPLEDNEDSLLSLSGNWAGELNVERTKLPSSRIVMESFSGTSSCQHNPFFALVEKHTNFQQGNCYGFNLMYSGNFENSVEKNSFGLIRVQSGISSFGFKKTLEKGEKFITPVALFSYSGEGINTLSDNFHRFITSHVLPEEFASAPHPVSYNNWEATGMKFNKNKIVALMKEASDLGVELFVLDDGWFSTRDDDAHGLGDWSVNTKKLPGGLDALAKEAAKRNLKFGIWMEPEMVSPDTPLYRNHPDWIIHDSLHKPSLGRHQFVLDLRKQEVQHFVYDAVDKVLSSADIAYLKWDFNRDMTDMDNRDGTFFYDYYVGLYKVLGALKKKYPKVLFENCASGGNRFDLGMMTYFSQSWMSDDTDSYQRTLIQEGGTLGYPLSIQSNHVSCRVSNQMLRNTSYDTKFDTACFGVLGYELDLKDLSSLDKEILKSQIAFYKEHRMTFQQGRVYTDQFYCENENKWLEVKGEKEALVAYYQKVQKPNPSSLRLWCVGLKENQLYTYKTRQESLPLQRFGNLVNYATLFHINPDGTMLTILSHHRDMKSEVDQGVVHGEALAKKGPLLSDEWMGLGYNEHTRLVGDFGARLYLIQEKEEKKEE